MKGSVYYPRIGWFSWIVLAFSITVIAVAAVSLPLWIALFCGVCIIALLSITLFGSWYVIDGASLIVYTFCIPRRFPISKIVEVRISGGFLSLSRPVADRLVVRFSDSRRLNGFAPLDIVPRDVDSFIRRLKSINPDIRIITDSGR